MGAPTRVDWQRDILHMLGVVLGCILIPIGSLLHRVRHKNPEISAGKSRTTGITDKYREFYWWWSIYYLCSYVDVAVLVIIRALHSPSLRTLPGDLSARIRDGIRPKRMAW